MPYLIQVGECSNHTDSNPAYDLGQDGTVCPDCHRVRAPIVFPDVAFELLEKWRGMGSDAPVMRTDDGRLLEFADPVTANEHRPHGPRTEAVYVPTAQEHDRAVREYYDHADSKRTQEGIPFRLQSAWINRTHCLAHSNTQKGSLSYYPSLQHMALRRLTVIRPGKYIERFYPDLSEQYKEVLYSTCRAFAGALKYEVLTDPDRIVQAFRFGPRSCMDGRGEHCTPYAEGHPTQAYGSTANVKSDLAVAVIWTDDQKNRSKARCVIWPEKKVYSTVYGDYALRHALECDGYTSGNFVGAKIRRVEYDGGILCPYMDGADQAYLTKNHIVFVNPDRTSRETIGVRDPCGYLEGYEGETGRSTCERCNSMFWGEDAYCSGCRDDSRECDYCSETYWPDDYDSYGEYCSRDCAQRSGNADDY